MQAVATAAGARAWVGYARHQVVVTEASPDLHAEPPRWTFDIGAGIYWRPEEGGLLWGMSNPDEEPGPGTFDRLAVPATDGAPALYRLLPARVPRASRKAWAATIEYTPDHFPLTRSAGAARRYGGGRRRRSPAPAVTG